MTTDKEELRKEFYIVMGYNEPFGNEYHNELFNWMWSKLEAKDKEIAELKSDKERLSKACNYIQSSRNELDQQITDLKAEIERLRRELKKIDDIILDAELYADSVARDAWDRACEAQRNQVKLNIPIWVKDSRTYKEFIEMSLPEYQPK